MEQTQPISDNHDEGEEFPDEVEDDDQEQVDEDVDQELAAQNQLLMQQYEMYQKAQLAAQKQQMLASQMQSNTSYGSNMINQSYGNVSYPSMSTTNSSYYQQNEAELSNPFENSLKQKSTSRWYYKDPHRQVRGPFTSFDMHTWYNEGYFTEDLEISLDGFNFFKLKNMRIINQNMTNDDNSVEYSSYHQTVPSNYGVEEQQYMNYSNYAQVDPQTMYAYMYMNSSSPQVYPDQYPEQQMSNYSMYQATYEHELQQQQMAYQNYIYHQQMSNYPQQQNTGGHYWP